MEVGIRELKNHLSRYLDRVRDGDEIVVTDRGRAITHVVPFGDERVLDRLVADGVVTPARREKQRATKPIAAKGSVSRPRGRAAQVIAYFDTSAVVPLLIAERGSQMAGRLWTPRAPLPTDSWTFTVEGLVEHPTTWTWDEMQALATVDVRRRHPLRHLVVEARHALLRRVRRRAARRRRRRATATHVVAFCATGYTTNLPLADVTGGHGWIAFEADGEPLRRDHGGPARLLVPHLYFWKSAKWSSGLTVLDHDEPGFWETQGYRNDGDPWREERYTGD